MKTYSRGSSVLNIAAASAAALSAMLLISCGGGGGGGSFPIIPTSTTTPTTPGAPSTPVAVSTPPPSAASCGALAATLAKANTLPPGAAIASATFVAATPTVPEHCNVLGMVNAGRVGAQSSPGVSQTYGIQWQVRLPTGWNNRFAMEGGGGLDGSIPATTSRLSSGYATAGSNSGHDNTVNTDPLAGGAAAFGSDYQARVDFSYNAIDQTTQISKALVSAYYGSAPQYSYFEGCSMGGREAMMVTQKLPDQFDGVVVGDPGFKLTAMSTHEVYNAQQLSKLAQTMGLTSVNGVPLISNTFTNNDLQLVSKAVLAACDGLDGLVDGMVNKPLECTTPVVTPLLNALTCSGAKDATCLTSAQINTLLSMYAGPVTPSGRKPYYGWMWDPGIAGCTSTADCNTGTATNIATGWRGWTLGTFQTNLATATTTANDFSAAAGGGLSTMLAPTPFASPAPAANEGLLKLMLNYDLDAYYASIFATSASFPVSSHALLDVDSTDLSPFKTHGGKVLIYQPQTGGPFSPLAMVDWYQSLNTANGGTPYDYSATQAFARLFMVPGAQHCGGGPSTSTFDAFSAVVQWVEAGKAPDKLVGTAPAATPWPGRTRPLCPFPQTAHYNGTGSIETESSFTCQ